MTAPALTSPRRARLPWALVPVLLLSSSALGVGWMALVASRDPHFATEPNYYQKAIGWDRTQAQAATNQRLGYAVVLPPSIEFDDRGRATVELSLRDRQGRPLRGARLAGQAFANAYSGVLLPLAFEERAPGQYAAALSVSHAGQWVFELVGEVEGQRFTAAPRADLRPGGAA